MSKFRQIIFFILIFLFISSLISNIFRYQDKINFYKQIKNEYNQELKKQIELKTKIAKQKSVIEVEKKIRNDLNLTKENEAIVIIPSPSFFPTPTPTPILKNWQKWIKVFF
ncbi:MAG: hypothetical protein Fur009_0690 [Candidatus Microgenomates bacterium]